MTLHLFNREVAHSELPKRFTYPFSYVPHPLCVEAANTLREKVLATELWQEELRNVGKMFGVLVVECKDGSIGYLAAFSGIFKGSNYWEGFVPTIFDILHPGSFFREGEVEISAINQRVQEMESSQEYAKQLDNIAKSESEFEQQIEIIKERNREAKIERDERRKSATTEDQLTTITNESIAQKGELLRLKQQKRVVIEELKNQLKIYNESLDSLKNRRKELSSALQNRIFEEFKVLNALGQQRGLLEIFNGVTPPAGSGECAAPKLLHYAYLNSLRPVSMAEFWIGEGGKAQLRKDGNFYPSCNSKCLPILTFMMQGLEVDENPLINTSSKRDEIEILYEDEYFIAIDKPYGLQSVNGRTKSVSVESLFAPYTIVHRLDMATSGILLLAKDSNTHTRLQQAFSRREVKKRYIAIAEGVIQRDSGEIKLPLCNDIENRPRQMVSYTLGKEAHTEFRVIQRENNRTRVELFPYTGRTHQLRVHLAHRDGLNSPIVGDGLYGQPDRRMMLHANYLKLKHPTTKEIVEIESPAPF